MWKKIKISSWKNFVDFLDENGSHKDTLSPWFYRGQSKQDWTLLPTISRIFKKYPVNLKKANGIEKNLFREFLESYHLFSSPSKEFDNKKSVALFLEMQHYSCPTRFLDWTLSPFVALYFAIENEPESNGKLFGFNSVILNSINNRRFGKLNMESVLSNIGEPAVHPILPARQNERSLSQQGVFTVSNNIFSDHYQIISNSFNKKELQNNTIEITISKELKIEFLARLRYMNISTMTLFPGLDGLGRSLTKLANIRAATNN
jgi:hypothetical protein